MAENEEIVTEHLSILEHGPFKTEDFDSELNPLKIEICDSRSLSQKPQPNNEKEGKTLGNQIINTFRNELRTVLIKLASISRSDVL